MQRDAIVFEAFFLALTLPGHVCHSDRMIGNPTPRCLSTSTTPPPPLYRLHEPGLVEVIKVGMLQSTLCRNSSFRVVRQQLLTSEGTCTKRDRKHAVHTRAKTERWRATIGLVTFLNASYYTVALYTAALFCARRSMPFRKGQELTHD